MVSLVGSLLCDCGDKLAGWDWWRLYNCERAMPHTIVDWWRLHSWIRSAIIETISFHYLLLATLRCNAGKTSTPNKTKTEAKTKTKTKYRKDYTCGIFSKRREFKDIKTNTFKDLQGPSRIFKEL